MNSLLHSVLLFKERENEIIMDIICRYCTRDVFNDLNAETVGFK